MKIGFFLRAKKKNKTQRAHSAGDSMLEQESKTQFKIIMEQEKGKESQGIAVSVLLFKGEKRDHCNLVIIFNCNFFQALLEEALTSSNNSEAKYIKLAEHCCFPSAIN